MSTKRVMSPDRVPMASSESGTELLNQYGCGPISFVGTESAFFERHPVFDRVIAPKLATARERFEAFSCSVRDILAQRWVLTKETHQAQERLGALYADPGQWAHEAILNVASSGKFSSDRTIAEYAADIGRAKPCLVL
jgi:hypothetical protein